MNIIRQVEATPTIDTNIYASGDLLGDKMEFSLSPFRDNANLLLRSVLITDLAVQSADVDLILFDSDPSNTTFTNNAALDVHDDDIGKIVAALSITTHIAFADNGVSIANNLEIPIHLAQSTSMTLYGALIARATPTYVSVADLVVNLGLSQG